MPVTSPISLGLREKASQRWYNPSPDVHYVLPSDEAERNRLTVQHFYAVRNLYDGKLVFAPGVRLKKGDKILDAATGSGIWLTELAKEVPECVELIGVDIQDQLFPKPSTAASNVKFYRNSTLSLPAAWSNTFRFINQRLLVCAFTEREWVAELPEILRVLVPGGRAQFTEAHLPTHNAGPAMRKLEAAVQSVYAAKGIFYQVPEFLPEMLRKLGAWGGKEGTLLAEIVIGMFSGHRGPILKLGLLKEAEIDSLLRATRREWDERPGMSRVYTTVYADKPRRQSL
ncbi:S-adenosyl-L-methionine-dependent methyltransferase [Mucidula mucida]|nr:S-adenosyl-L-methionine-dependent methyltransferase [Mucidula mucida]